MKFPNMGTWKHGNTPSNIPQIMGTNENYLVPQVFPLQGRPNEGVCDP
jgi:hypothetical protein